MKATIEFQLPEESYEYRLHVHAADLATALDDVRGMLWDKHSDLDGMTADGIIDEIWERFHDIAGQVMEATE